MEEQLSVEKEKLVEEEKKFERIVFRKRKLTDDISEMRDEMKSWKHRRESSKDNETEGDDIPRSRSDTHKVAQCKTFHFFFGINMKRL